MATYAQIAQKSWTVAHENGNDRTYQLTIEQLNGTVQSYDIPLIQDIIITMGDPGDEINKPIKTHQMQLQLMDESTAGDVISLIDDCGHKELRVKLEETNTGYVLFQGFIVADRTEFNLYEKVQSISINAIGSLNELALANIAINNVRLDSLLDAINTALDIPRESDVYTSIYATNKTGTDILPEYIGVDFQKALTDEITLKNSIENLLLSFGWQLFQENGRLVVADVYDRYNASTLKRFKESSGVFTLTTRDTRIELDETNVIRGGKFKQLEPVNSYQHNFILTQREILSISPQNWVSPGTVTQSNGLMRSGDEISFRNWGTIEIDTQAGSSAKVEFKYAQLKIDNEVDGNTYWYDFDAEEWITNKVSLSLEININALESHVIKPFGSQDDIISIIVPDNMVGRLEVVMDDDTTFTQGSGTIDAILHNLRVGLPQRNDFATNPIKQVFEITSDQSVQKILYSNFYIGQKNDYIRDWQAIQSSLATNNNWSDGSVTANLGTLVTDRIGRLLIGKRKQFTVILRDEDYISLLSSFKLTDNNNNEHIVLPVSIKHNVLRGYYEVACVSGFYSSGMVNEYYATELEDTVTGSGSAGGGSTASNGVTDHGQLTGLNRPADHPWALKTDFSNITDIDDLKSLLDNEYLIKSLNLSDVDSIPTARSNLSIYSKSESDNRYLRRSNNLNDLQNVQTARNNLDVWSKAEADNLYLSRLNHTDILYDKLIGINDYLTADSQNRKLYAWELEINNLAQPVGTEHTEYFKTLRDGYSPLDYTAHDVSYEATSGGYALFSSINAWLETEMIDLSGKTAVKISFDVAKYGTGADGPLHVQYSINDGATWLNLGLSEIPTDSTYKKTTLSVPYVSDEMRFRFLRHYSNSAKRLRDIEIKAKDTIEIGERYIITTDGADLIIKEDVNELLRLSDLGDLSVKNIKVTNAIEPGGIYYANAQGYAENSEYATLNPNGEMTVKSLHVTQRMTVNELEVIKMRYSFGSHVFGVGGGIVNKVTDDGNGYFYLEFTEPHGMTNDDYLMLQVFDPTSHNTLRYAELEVISVVDLKEIYVRMKSGGDDPIEGDHVVVVASTDSNRDSFIYINPYGPHIDLYDEVEKIDDFILGIPKVRIGELSGLPQIGDITPSGYSLFAEKAFLKDAIISGAIYLTNDQTSNIAGEVILDIDGAITNEDGDFILNKDGLMLSPSSDYNVPGSMIMFGDENELYGFIRADFNENRMIISTPMNKDILIAPGDFNKPNNMGNLIIRTAGFVPPNNHFGIILENLTNTDPSVYAPVGTLWRDGSGYVRIV